MRLERAEIVVVVPVRQNTAHYRLMAPCVGDMAKARRRWHRNNLTIVWRELGGPHTAPKQSGFGTSLIRDLIPHELGGRVDLMFEPDGVCRIDFLSATPEVTRQFRRACSCCHPSSLAGIFPIKLSNCNARRRRVLHPTTRRLRQTSRVPA